MDIKRANFCNSLIHANQGGKTLTTQLKNKMNEDNQLMNTVGRNEGEFHNHQQQTQEYKQIPTIM